MKHGQSNHYTKKMKNGNKLESIDYIQSVMGDKFQYGCWFNILKYPARAYDKHENPADDIKKTMHYCLFLLNDLAGREATHNQVRLFRMFEDVERCSNEIYSNEINNNERYNDELTKDMLNEMLENVKIREDMFLINELLENVKICKKTEDDFEE